MAIINSKLMNFYHANKYLDQSKNLFQKILIQNCKLFPIPVIDISNKQQKATHDKIVKHVETIETLQQTLLSNKNPNQTEQLENRIIAEESRLDFLIGEMYGLTTLEMRTIK